LVRGAGVCTTTELIPEAIRLRLIRLADVDEATVASILLVLSVCS